MALQGISNASVNAILSFRNRFALQTDFVAGTLAESEVQNLMADFASSLDQHGVTQIFDWDQWVQTNNIPLEDPVFMSNADQDTLQKLITAHLRMDRFIRGHLANLVRNGYFISFLNRLEVLNAG